MTIYLTELSRDNVQFPNPHDALVEPNGLLAYGGDLSSDRLISAYRQGIFPWFNDNEPLLWWSPDPRCVILPSEFLPSRSLKKSLRKWQPRISINMAFNQVVRKCASVKRADNGTWILPAMEQAYCQLHAKGVAHSIEVWEEDVLVGGLYGVLSGSVFSGESMFHSKTDASKIAFWALCEQMLISGGKLVDCQITNPHLVSLGAYEIPREQYLSKLAVFRNQPLLAELWQPREMTIGATTT